ncbi:hypothetical protein SKM54_04495 [Acinetobacter faecalis]|uniref:hypothetical protein n=1 Tax=Acinetobacter faecalis TaxID=2665161 RepID=UPI002A91F53D|nr:hypothetical protein [Acinetobacter faecalis]MDY6481709.1 hypothetical protein [Acinetobacter faecalis]
MAGLDVSDVLLDPDFMEKGLVCKRTIVDVGSNGRPIKTESSHPFNAVVTTNSGINLDRQPDGTIIKGAINLHTRFALIAGGEYQQADEVVWRNQTYIVIQALPNLHYGRGFVKAVCIIKPITG